MKKAQLPLIAELGPNDTEDSTSSPVIRFSGTSNPRHIRALLALLKRPLSREEVDSIAGCANGPELISNLRHRGLGKKHLTCVRIEFIDRDGKPCRPGVYSLTPAGKATVRAWLQTQKGVFLG